MSEHSPIIEIDGGGWINEVAFSVNGEHLLSGGHGGIRVWQVEDGKEVATMTTTGLVYCLALSKDGRWIAAGTSLGELIIWDAKTYEKLFSHKDDSENLYGVDFSPDSTRLVVASKNRTATIWNLATRRHWGQVLGPLRHADWVRAAKYSPQGDRIATATENAVRVYDSNDCRLLVNVEVQVTPWLNAGLLWSNDQLFVVSDGKIKQLEASTGSAVSEWPVIGRMFPRIALPQHGKFIAYSANCTVSFWDTSTNSQLGLIQHAQSICSIALSPDSRSLAIGGEDGKIIVKNLSWVTESIPLPRLHPTFQEPGVHIDDAALDSWKNDQFVNANALLTQAIANSRSPSHHVLASRALVRARLRYWDTAIEDAKMSIIIHPSVIGYIAKSVALVGNGKKHEAYRACDIAFELFHSTHVTSLLLIKAIIVFMAGEHDDAMSRLDDLIATLPMNSICHMVQARAYMYLLIGNSRIESRDYKRAIQSFERARTRTRRHGSGQLLVISLISGWKFDGLDITIQQRLCEALYAAGRAKEGCESLLNMMNTLHEEVYKSGPMTKWVSDYTQRCLSTPASNSNVEPSMLHPNLNSTTPTPLLREWVKSTLSSSEWKDALVATVGFTATRFTIYRAICEYLEITNLITNAIECFQRMDSELAGEITTHHEQAKWAVDFKRRCSRKIEDLGDTAMSAERHNDAIFHYSAVLSVDPAAPQGVFIKRSRAYIARGLWADALNDANKVITLDPSSPWGYERRHAALHKAGDYENAIDAFEAMISKMSQSPDPNIREYSRLYVDPSRTKAAIRTAIQNVIRESPLVLINTNSGRLLDKSGQASSFESQPIFRKLVSSMTIRIDHVRIEQEVAEYYRYATFSHKWEENEPLFEKVVHIIVYDLEESPTHDKLQMFCKIVRDAGLHWAWSDTCCINKTDHFVLQEALVSMFKWYQGSTMTIIFLRGVRSLSLRGALARSIWNTRAWTLQEYHASKVVRFYTEDWTPYLSLSIPNHKESPEIISEMEEATGVSARSLVALRPGLDNIREKLRLASTRKTTRVEDAAYSLLGIFSISLPVVYGEGNKALGRLLAQLLTSSGDTSILAWTGRSGGFNSCLPASITIFSQLPTSHIPLAIEGAEMDVVTSRLRASSLNIALVTELYDQLNRLPIPLFADRRVRLPCIIFKLGPVSASRSKLDAFRAQTAVLGVVEIKTKEDLSRLNSLYLIHPWIDFLLDRQPVASVAETIPEENTDEQSSSMGELPPFAGPSNIAPATPRTRAARLVARLGWPFGGRPPRTTPQDVGSLRPPSSVLQTERETRALRLMARLRQPFGALLLAPDLGNVAAYRRVAAESLITVQVEEITPRILNKLVDSVRILDVL